MAPGRDRREENRARTFHAIQAAAHRLITANGYERTTVDQITYEANVSPRTFFRYFECKEAVLFGDWRGSLQRLHDAVVERPATDGPLSALAQALLIHRDEPGDGEAATFPPSVETSEPASRYEQRVIAPERLRVLAMAIGQRLDVNPAEDLRPRLVAGAGLAALEAARAARATNPAGPCLDHLTRQAFEQLRRLD